ncbi:MAG TPA: phenylacetate--CoA ligase family protein [Albitalea sp.]
MPLPAFDPWLTGLAAADVAWATREPAEALERRRSQRLARLLAAAAEASPLYRRVLKGQDPARTRLQDLPIARKSELMARFADWVADPRLELEALRAFTADPSRIADPFLGRYVVWESSGSSGEPGVFVQDASAMAVYDALEALRRPRPQPLERLFDPWYLGETIAFVGATQGHFASTVSTERLRRLNPLLAAHLREVSFLQPTERLVAELDALAPSVLSTYPSAAVLLAEERLAGRSRLAPREVWTGGETLSPSMRRYVQAAFGCPLVDSYGASEFLALAFECRSGRLHLNSDWAILESVDDKGRPMPPRELGATALLTNLANHVQPLIRYDLGDRVRMLSQPCECGSHLPAIEVQGRCDDSLLMRGATGRAVRVLPLALSTVLEDDAGLFDFQLEQQGPCELSLHTPMHGPAAEAALRRARAVLVDFLARQGVPAARIHCRCGEPNRVGSGGKVRRVVAQGRARRTDAAESSHA